MAADKDDFLALCGALGLYPRQRDDASRNLPANVAGNEPFNGGRKPPQRVGGIAPTPRPGGHLAETAGRTAAAGNCKRQAGTGHWRGSRSAYNNGITALITTAKLKEHAAAARESEAQPSRECNSPPSVSIPKAEVGFDAASSPMGWRSCSLQIVTEDADTSICVQVCGAATICDAGQGTSSGDAESRLTSVTPQRDGGTFVIAT